MTLADVPVGARFRLTCVVADATPMRRLLQSAREAAKAERDPIFGAFPEMGSLVKVQDLGRVTWFPETMGVREVLADE